MNARRTIIHMLLGLVLLLQGLAVAAAPHALMSTPPSAEHAETVPPCHGGMVMIETAPSQSPADPSCCGDDCPNTASCLLAHLALSTAKPLPVLDIVHAPPLDVLARSPQRERSDLLRPPITLHH